MKKLRNNAVYNIILLFLFTFSFGLGGCAKQKRAQRPTRPDFTQPAEDQVEITEEERSMIEFRRTGDPSCQELAKKPGVIWYGKKRYMTFAQLAAYAGPVLWFSPDEPLLREKSYKEINMPMAMPFEENPGKPVVYYRLRNVIAMPHTEYRVFDLDEKNIGRSIIDLQDSSGLDLDYFFYYPEEEGFGYHPHDIESAELKLGILHNEDSKECPYAVVLEKVTAKAHGVKWYDNVLVVDEDTKLPLYLFVEEGKHASCPDKNQDGYYTPSYDVNRRTNDAWGVRDSIRSGKLFSGKYKSWMSKVRRDQDRVFPPLPYDSPLRKKINEQGEYQPLYNKYILRPLPDAKLAGDDKLLYKKLQEKEKKHEEWPDEITGVGDVDAFKRWVEEDNFTRATSLAFRFDDNNLGMTIIFPLLIFKGVEMPMTGGYLVNRVYLKDELFRDLGWGIMYAPSASRWVDWYMVLGLEVDENDTATGSKTDIDFTTEGGLKFRTRIPKLGWWGFRFGIKNKGYPSIHNLGYIIEFGMGAF